MDALRNLRRDGGEPDAAAAARRCSVGRVRSAGSGAQRPCRSHGGLPLRSHRRNTCCRGRTACRARPSRRSGRRQALGGCPRRSFAIEGWTATRVSGDTVRSRPNGESRSRVSKEARRVATPCAGLPSCTGLMVAAPCSDTPRTAPASSGGQRLRRRRREPEPRAALRGTESEPAQTAGIRRIQAAVYTSARAKPVGGGRPTPRRPTARFSRVGGSHRRRLKHSPMPQAAIRARQLANSARNWLG